MTTTMDREALRLLCEALALRDQAAAELSAEGATLVVTTATGASKANPLIHIRNRAEAHAVRLMVEFGLTPASRTRLASTEGGGAAGGDPDADAIFD